MCLEDLRASFALVERNYAGYADKRSRLGADVVARAQEAALQQIGDSQDPERCREVVNSWLAIFADKHLGLARMEGGLTPPPTEQARDRAPEFEVLSDEATWIRSRSFMPWYHEAIDELVDRHRDEILARPVLIIDVRDNEGGTDLSYRALAELVYAEPVKFYGVDVFATPENTAAWERMAAKMNAEDSARLHEKLVLMKAHPGEWVTLAEDSVEARDTVYAQPARVAVLTDAGCGSSCEQFVLEARASSKVRVFGRPTAGVLDYANVGVHTMPSGLPLWIPTSRSRRLPEHPIDGIGILPDVEMDPALFDGSTRAEALARVVEALNAGVSPRER